MSHDLEKSRRILELERFLGRLLNPSDMGHEVSARVRDEARALLGMPKVEKKKGNHK